MLHALGLFKPVLLATLLLTLSHGLMSTILSVRLAQMDASAQIAGAITTAYFLGYALGSRFGYRLLGRAGHIRAFATVTAAASICILAIPMIPEPLAWVVIRFAMGVFLVLAFLVIESWLNAMAGNEMRGAVFGVYITIFNVGMVGGQALLGFMDVTGFQVFSIAAMVLLLAMVPMTLTRAAQPDLPPPSRLRLMDLVRISPVGIAAAVVSGELIGAIFGLFPFFAVSIGLSTAGVATFMSAVVGGGLVMNWPLGKLSDRIDRRLVIAGAALAIVGASVVLGLGQTDLVVLVAVGGLMGGATAALYSLGAAHTNDYVGGGDAVAVGAGLLLAFGLGAMTGPSVAGLLMDLLGTPALFGFTGTVALLLAGLALYRISARRATHSDDKMDFVTLSRATPVTYAPDSAEGGDVVAKAPAESGT
jgi:MFS family permease